MDHVHAARTFCCATFSKIAVIFALFVLLVAAPLWAKPNPVSIPFTISTDGMVMVPATAGGSISIRVIFDTGAGFDVFAPSLIEKLHGKPLSQFSGFRMTGERIDIPLFVIDELSIGPMVKKNAVVGGWDALDKLHLDGIVSLNDFREQPLTFDFVNQMLIFETPDSLAQRRASGKSVPAQFDDQRKISLNLFAGFLIEGLPCQCEIDTGSQSVTASTRYMAQLGIDKNGKDVKKHEGRTIAGAAETRYETSLSQISLSAAPQISVTHPGVLFSDIIYDCVVGIDFWSGKTITVDIPGKQLIVFDPSPAH
jgi:hypothetical protein